MKPDESFDEVVEDLVRMTDRMKELLSRLYAGRDGAPGAARYDTVKRGSTVKFCERHESDDCDCGESTTYPTVSDPTGEAAVRLAGRSDVARTDIGRYHDAVRLIRKGRQILLELDGAWMPHGAPVTFQQATADKADPGCRLCARTFVSKGIARWMPVHRGDLCRWHYEWERSTGRAATDLETAEYHATGRVKRPA